MFGGSQVIWQCCSVTVGAVVEERVSAAPGHKKHGRGWNVVMVAGSEVASVALFVVFHCL